MSVLDNKRECWITSVSVGSCKRAPLPQQHKKNKKHVPTHRRTTTLNSDTRSSDRPSSKQAANNTSKQHQQTSSKQSNQKQKTFHRRPLSTMIRHNVADQYPRTCTYSSAATNSWEVVGRRFRTFMICLKSSLMPWLRAIQLSQSKKRIEQNRKNHLPPCHQIVCQVFQNRQRRFFRQLGQLLVQPSAVHHHHPPHHTIRIHT